MWWVLLLLLFATPALAQQPQEPAAMRGLALALQQMATATEQYISDVNQRLAAKDARIAELIKLCGEPCKPTAEAK